MFGRTVEIPFRELSFPFLSSDIPRTGAYNELLRRDDELPAQCIYAQNVLPQKEGYASVERIQQIPPSTVSPSNEFYHAFPFVGRDGLNYLAAKTTNGIAIIRNGNSAWRKFIIQGLSGNFDLTSAFIDGEQYFYFSNTICKKFVTAGGTYSLEDQVLTGLNNASIKGITAASGYMVAYTSDKIFWDAPQTRANFTPAVGGAGSQKISYLKGAIIAALPLANGYVIYSSNNAVGAQYTGNANFPWVFREISSSAGIKNIYNVASHSNLPAHFAWTFSGLQEISFDSAQNFAPEVAEYLFRGILESYSSLTGFSFSTMSKTHEVKVDLVGHRYLCLSYGPQKVFPESVQIFQGALIFDKDLGRWGKLVFPHVSLCNFTFGAQTYYLTYQDAHLDNEKRYSDYTNTKYADLQVTTPGAAGLLSTIASITSAGEVYSYKRANLNEASAPAYSSLFQSFLALGRISFFKQRPTMIHSIEIQKGQVDKEFSIDLFSSLTYNPYNVDVVTETVYARPRSDFVHEFLTRLTARHFIVVAKGRFELTNVQIKFEPAGRV